MAKTALKKCTSASEKHRWQFVRNALHAKKIDSHTVDITSYGIYRCVTCGGRKTGAYRQQFGVEK